MRIQSTATQVNTIRRLRLTSLLAKGEVEPEARTFGAMSVPKHDGIDVGVGVVGGSRLDRGHARKDGRSARKGRAFMVLSARRTRLAEVRAIIVAKKRGNSRGAKGGRKAEIWTCCWAINIQHRLLLGVRTLKTEEVRPMVGKGSAEAIGNHRGKAASLRRPLSSHPSLYEANC
jgi:hypothetical protein